MTINRKIKINRVEAEITNATDPPGLILTPDLMSEISRTPGLLAAIAELLPHIAPALQFDDFLSVADFDRRPLERQIADRWTMADLTALLNNPLLSNEAARIIRAHINMYDASRGKRDPGGYIYLIRANLPGRPCKIGRSANLPDRLKMFGVKLPFDFELLHTIPAADAYAAERMLHNHYADKRGHGEWFNLTDGDIENIRAIETL